MNNIIEGIGTDIIEIERIKKSIEHHKDTFINRIFTSRERKYCEKFKNPYPHFAVRFAAKEAVAKALGTGINSKVNWLDIEICNEESGKPYVIYKKSNSKNIFLSISHSEKYAVAFAVITN